MYQARDLIEARLIQKIAQGDAAARRSYAGWLNDRGEAARAAFLYLERSVLHAPWRASLDGGWLDKLEIEWIRALGHEAIQFSTWDAAVPPLQWAQRTARTAYKVFRPQYLLISAAGTLRGAADWAVRDLRVGNFSRFRQSGDISGDIFARPEIDRYVELKQTIYPSTEIRLTVSYIGPQERGVPFCGWLVGSLVSATANATPGECADDHA